MPRKRKQDAIPVIQPVVSGGDVDTSKQKPHPLETAEEKGKLPVLVSVGYARLKPGSRDFVSYVIRSQGREILSIEVGDPNLKAIAADEAKINFVTLLDDVDQVLEEDIKHIEEEQNRIQAQA